MNHILPVSNLNNSIRFYNRLSGQRPEKLTYNYAYYKLSRWNIEVELFENGQYQFSSNNLNIIIPEEYSYQHVFREMKRYTGFNPGFGCKVLEDFFTIIDPDNHIWVISKYQLSKEQISEVKETGNCFLEPFNQL